VAVAGAAGWGPVRSLGGGHEGPVGVGWGLSWVGDAAPLGGPVRIGRGGGGNYAGARLKRGGWGLGDRK